MILTVTLNAALDRTLAVPNFSVGHQHRATDSLLLPGERPESDRTSGGGTRRPATSIPAA